MGKAKVGIGWVSRAPPILKNTNKMIKSLSLGPGLCRSQGISALELDFAIFLALVLTLTFNLLCKMNHARHSRLISIVCTTIEFANASKYLHTLKGVIKMKSCQLRLLRVVATSLLLWTARGRTPRSSWWGTLGVFRQLQSQQENHKQRDVSVKNSYISLHCQVWAHFRFPTWFKFNLGGWRG